MRTQQIALLMTLIRYCSFTYEHRYFIDGVVSGKSCSFRRNQDTVFTCKIKASTERVRSNEPARSPVGGASCDKLWISLVFCHLYRWERQIVVLAPESGGRI
jgi:hypothetical protein